MADPLTIMAIVGAGVTAFGQIRQGRAARKAGEFNARVAENEAIFQRESSVAEAARHRRETKRRLGTIRAQLGAVGQEGATALNLLAESAEQAELDRQIILTGGQIRGQAATNRATLARFEGKSAERAGYIGAGGTILTSAALFRKTPTSRLNISPVQRR